MCNSPKNNDNLHHIPAHVLVPEIVQIYILIENYTSIG